MKYGFLTTNQPVFHASCQVLNIVFPFPFFSFDLSFYISDVQWVTCSLSGEPCGRSQESALKIQSNKGRSAKKWRPKHPSSSLKTNNPWNPQNLFCYLLLLFFLRRIEADDWHLSLFFHSLFFPFLQRSFSVVFFPSPTLEMHEIVGGGQVPLVLFHELCFVCRDM